MENSILSVAMQEWKTYHWFEFSKEYLIPIIGCLALIIGGIWTVYQYFNNRNHEFHKLILENVYAPLFEALIENEYGRKLIKNNEVNIFSKFRYSARNIPFFCIENTSGAHGTNENRFEKTLREINNDHKRIQYAPRDLVALMKAYFYLENYYFNTCEKNKLHLQRKIRKNVIIGYKKYRKRLGLRDCSMLKFCYSIRGWLFLIDR